MKKIMVVIPLLLILLSSCGLSYKRVQIEHLRTDATITTTEVKIKTNGRVCLSKEITTRKDTITQKVVFKEEVTSNCHGAFTQVVKRKTTELIDGKKVVIITDE